MNIRIGIIGGGASGMMAAIAAASQNASVTIIEHTDRIGKKILSTGNGKCNFTNQNLSKDDYSGNHPSFVDSVFQNFNQESAVLFFERAGMPAVSKHDGYFYPNSGQALTVLNTLRLLLKKYQVCIRTEEVPARISKKQDLFYVKTQKNEYVFDRIILACGGRAFSKSGSDGSGYQLAGSFGHKIIPPLPALTALLSDEQELKNLAGVRILSDIFLYVGNQEIARERGELQLIRTGVSGIPVFQISHKAVRALQEKKTVNLFVDFMPSHDKRSLKEMILGLRNFYPDSTIAEVMSCITNKKVIEAVLHKTSLPFGLQMKQWKDEQMESFIEDIKFYRFALSGFPDFEAAQVCQGGIDTEELYPWMESKLVNGLYFAGEIVDIDGKCGGYNLQWAWSSGYSAGCHAVLGEVPCYE